MRYSSFVAAALLLFTVSGSQAQSVLLPPCEGADCNNTQSSTGAKPNLGIAPNPMLPPEPPKEIVTPKPLVPIKPDLYPSQPVTKPPVLTTITPGGKASTNYQTEEERLQALAREYGISPDALKPTFADPEVQRFYDAKEKRKIHEPIMINDADALSNPTADEEITGKFPNVLAVNVSGNYMWGDNDIKTVQDALGYGPNVIATKCQLMVKSKLTTDLGAFSNKVFSGQQGTIKYEGIFSNIAYVAYAVCHKPSYALPKKGSVIFKMGNMYAVQMKDFVTCNAPTKPMFASLTIKYLGDNKGECIYQ